MRGCSALQAVHRSRERVRECTEEGERSRNASEIGQLVPPFCFLIDVTYMPAGVCNVQVRIPMAALMNPVSSRFRRDKVRCDGVR